MSSGVRGGEREREDIEPGAAWLGLSLDDPIQQVITAMQEVAGPLGLARAKTQTPG